MSDPNIEALPPEIIQEVMSGLPPESLIALANTSPILRQNVTDYMQHLVATGQLTDSGNERLIRCFPRIDSWRPGSTATSVRRRSRP